CRDLCCTSSTPRQGPLRPASSWPLPKRVYRKAHAAVRFFGDSLDPLVVTQTLRLPPDRTARVGEPRLSRTKSGKVIEQPEHRSGMWLMSSVDCVSSTKLATHIEWLLGELEPR